VRLCFNKKKYATLKIKQKKHFKNFKNMKKLQKIKHIFKTFILKKHVFNLCLQLV